MSWQTREENGIARNSDSEMGMRKMTDYVSTASSSSHETRTNRNDVHHFQTPNIDNAYFFKKSIELRFLS